MTRHASLYARLVANTAEPEAPTGCWRWTGRTDGKRGGQYGRLNVRVNGKHKTLQAHRVMEQELRHAEAQRVADDAVQGDWFSAPLPTVRAPTLDPVDETLDHYCYEPACVCPDHWTPVALSVNSAGRRNPHA